MERNSTSRKEARNRIRQELQRRREEARRLNVAEEKERERERLFAPPPSSPLSSSESSVSPITPSQAPTHVHAPDTKASNDDGWDQGDGRRADQVLVYETLPNAVRARLEPTKSTHFRFRNPSDERALLEVLSTPGQTATYQAKGKKDVTITSTDGQLLGNIHFLHVDGRDVHRPEKYYMKFYLFNFSDANLLRDTKQRLLQFTRSFSSSRPPVPTRMNHSTRPSGHSGHSGPVPSRIRHAPYSRRNRSNRRNRSVRSWAPTRKNKQRRNLK